MSEDTKYWLHFAWGLFPNAQDSDQNNVRASKWSKQADGNFDGFDNAPGVQDWFIKAPA